MAEIQVMAAQTLYRAPTKGRRYLTARAAANAEARAQLDSKYPYERPEYEQGHMISSGWHWSADPKLVAAHKRLSRVLLKALRRSHAKNQPESTHDTGNV